MSYHHQRGGAASYFEQGAEFMDEDEGHIGGRRLSSGGPGSGQSGRKHSLGSASGTYGGGSGTSPTKVARHESFEQNEYQDEAEANLVTFRNSKKECNW